MTRPAKRKFTAAEIRAALKRRFAAPECAIVYEVAQSTGFAARRHLDAVAMELWPSRGLALHGIEIKVSLQDWRREKAAPEKAEEIARFCDYFWIAAPKDLIPVAELPSAWGLLELDGEAIVERIRAAKTEAEDVGRPFLAAMLRAASRGLDPDSVEAILDKRAREQEEDFEGRVKAAVDLRAGQGEHDAKSWRKLCEALGVSTRDFLVPDDHVIAAVNVVIASGVCGAYTGLRSLESQLKASQERLSAALDSASVPGLAETKLKKAARRRK